MRYLLIALIALLVSGCQSWVVRDNDNLWRANIENPEINFRVMSYQEMVESQPYDSVLVWVEGEEQKVNRK